jgi:hypothetical protein
MNNNQSLYRWLMHVACCAGLSAGVAQAQQLLLSDSFDSPSYSAGGFNNTLADDQMGSVATTAYTVTTGGQDWQAQHGNGAAMLLAGDSSYSATASLNYNFATLANAANSPLQIKFTGYVSDTGTPSCWFSFAIGSAQNILGNNASAKFAILPTLGTSVQVWASGSGIGNVSRNTNNYTVVLANTAGTGSAFNGGGSVAKLYNGTNLLGSYTLSQLGSGDGYVSFAANPYNGSYNLTHIDNLSVSNLTGTVTVPARLLSDSFDSASYSAAGFNSTLLADQGGIAAPTAYSVTTAGQDWQAQHGAGGAILLVGDNGYGATASLNRNFAALANAANSPLQIKFDGYASDTTTPGCWFSFAIGSAQNIYGHYGTAKFGVLSTWDGTVQVWASGAGITNVTHSTSNYTVFLANTPGTGSAFNGAGSVATVYDGTNLLGTYTLSQLGSGDGYISFAANPYNGSWNVAHIDNLSITNLAGTIFPRFLTWSGAASGNWNTTQTNWTGGGTGWDNLYDHAIFGSTGAGTVTLTEAIIARSITFNTAGYTLTGGSLALTGAQAISNNVNATINSPLDSSGLNKYGTGTLTLGGNAIYLGALSVNAGIVSLSSPLLSGCTRVTLAAGAKMNLNYTGTNAIAALTVNGTNLPVGTYNAQHPTYGSYFTGAGSLRIFPLTYLMAGGNEFWPPGIRAELVAYMNEAVATFNAHGYFPMQLTANYSAGVPTAQASYGGWIDFGGSRSTRTALHEMGHCLGVGTYYPAWANNQSGGQWTGVHANQRIQLYDGTNATIGCDAAHHWPYGMNYAHEDSPTARYRQPKIVAAMRWDMGIVADSDNDGVPDDWNLFWFGTATPSVNASNNLAAYLADVSPIPIVSLVQTNLAFSISGTNLTLSWPADHTGWTLLKQTNRLNLGISANTNDWMRVPASSATNSVVIPIVPDTPGGYYRLVYP